MDDLIAALQIFRKCAGNLYNPTHCEHDVLMVVGVTREQVSSEDLVKLEQLGFRWMPEYDVFGSTRFGSA